MTAISKAPRRYKWCDCGGRSGMQCKASVAPRYAYRKRPTTQQCARYGCQNCATNICAAPKVALGLGCDRGTSRDTLCEAVAAALAQARAKWADVAAVASITLKADEAGLLALAAAQGWMLRFYTPAELADVPVPNPSETVRRYTGTPSVSEAAALLAAGPATPMTALIVEKYKHLGADGRNVTVSIARMRS